MKLIPESLKESQNFERGQEPKSAMDIGRGRPLQPGERVKLLSILNGMEGKAFSVGTILRIQINGDIVVHEISGKEIVMDPDYVIRESQNFERGMDPKTSMEIGDAAILPGLIDSNILNAISSFNSFSEEEYKEFYDSDEDPEEKNYQFVKRAKNFLKGKVTFGKFFDYREEQQMGDYIHKYNRGRYIYNAAPGTDGWHVVFSKIYLPRAEAIEI